MKHRRIPIEYVETTVMEVYRLTRILKPGSAHRYVYNAAVIAEKASTEERPVSEAEIQTLWKNYGSCRDGFIKDVEWRMANGVPLTNKMPDIVRSRLKAATFSEAEMIPIADHMMRNARRGVDLRWTLEELGKSDLYEAARAFMGRFRRHTDFFTYIGPKVHEWRKNGRRD